MLQGRTARNRAFTLLELMLVVAVLAIIIAMAIPGYLNSKKQANETSAIASLKNITLAQTQYRVRFGVYATLANLTASELVDSSFMDSEKSGYQFTPNGVATRGRWGINADPLTPGVSGNRYFYADHTGVIRFKLGGQAGSTDSAVD
jgi:prepilin-type N-terminal cleavage/methylation domain-containing protein